MKAQNGHLRVLGLARNPFPPTPDAGSYFWTPYLEEQVTEIEQCVLTRKGISLVTAEVGMGKSTLVRLLIERLYLPEFEVALVFNTFLQGPELLAAVLQDFGLPSQGNMAADIEQLNQFLLQSHAAGKTCLLILDDAQNLSPSSLELVRLLCNLETDQEKLLQILLVGQPELEDTLAQHGLRQLRSRLVKQVRLFGLTQAQLAHYVAFRLERAGAEGRIELQPKACAMLWQQTQGVPRLVHLVMDRCLYGLVAHQSRVIDTKLMGQALADCQCEWALRRAPAKAAPFPSAPPRARRRAPVLARNLLVTALGLTCVGLLALPVLQQDPLRSLPWLVKAANPEPAMQDVQALHADTSLTPAPAALPAPSTALAPDAAPSPAADNSVPVAVCMPGQSWPAGPAVRSQALSAQTTALFEARLARLPHGCVFQREGLTWLSWADSAAGLDVSDSATVKRLQQALFNYGSLTSEDVDGWWGPRSRSAVQGFQAATGLAETGAPDSLTVFLLEQFYAGQT